MYHQEEGARSSSEWPSVQRMNYHQHHVSHQPPHHFHQNATVAWTGHPWSATDGPTPARPWRSASEYLLEQQGQRRPRQLSHQWDHELQHRSQRQVQGLLNSRVEARPRRGAVPGAIGNKPV